MYIADCLLKYVEETMSLTWPRFTIFAATHFPHLWNANPRHESYQKRVALILFNLHFALSSTHDCQHLSAL